MSIRVNVLVLVLLMIGLSFTAVPKKGEIEGSWVARLKDDKVRLSFTMFDEDNFRGEWNSTEYFEKDEFSGMQFDTEHEFSLNRDAGSMKLFGKISDVRGYGDFTFEPNKEFNDFLFVGLMII